MARRDRKKDSFMPGVVISLSCHLLTLVVAVLVLEKRAETAMLNEEIFTVTLEGGETLGGINQLPELGAKKQELKQEISDTKEEESLPPPAPVEEEPEAEQEQVAVEEPEETKSVDKIKEAAAIELAKQKKEEERKKKEAEEAKRKAEEKKRKAEEAKKAAEEKRRREEEERKRKAEEARKRAAQEKADRERKFNEIMKRSSTGGYKGESYDAGGKGFGAAKLGGKGTGGGTLSSLEFIAYRNQLESHIKRGWSWVSTESNLQAQVIIRIQPDGIIQDVRVVAGSGNARFDDSIIRAVQKASPVPPASERLYPQFKEVRITFDSDK